MDFRALLARAGPSQWLALLRRPAAIYLAASIAGRLGSIVLVPIYARRLTLGEYGEYVLVQTLIPLCPTVLSLCLVVGITRFFFTRKDPKEGSAVAVAVARMALLVALVLTSVVLLGGYVLTSRFGGALINPGTLVTVCVAGLGATGTLAADSLLRAQEKATAVSLLQVGEFALTAVLGAVLVGVKGWGLTGALVATALASGITGIVAAGYVLTREAAPITRELVREAMRLSFPFIPHFLAVWAQSVSDRWILGATAGAASLGPYSVGAQLSSPCALVVSAWNQDRGTRTGELYSREGLTGLRAQMTRIRLGYVAASLLPAIPLLLGMPLLRLFVGARMEGGLVFVLPMIVVLTVEALYHPHNHVVYFSGHVAWVPAVTGLSAVVSVAAGFLLIPSFGSLGAILARGVGASVRTLAMWLAAERCFRMGAADAPAR